MADRDEMNFEKELCEKLKKFDQKIKDPEIPDVQNIFEKAESKKSNTVPFKKYSRYAAAAAAAVLLCVAIPAVRGFSGMNLESANNAPQEINSILDVYDRAYDVASEEAEVIEESEIAAEQEPEQESELETETVNGTSSKGNNGILDADSVKSILYSYFTENEKKEKTTESSSAHRPQAGTDDVRIIEKEINEERNIKVTLENEKISVKLFDVFEENEVSEEIVQEFWVEGIFESSYLNGEYYIINLVKPLNLEELEEENYLPKYGTDEEENVIPEESLFVSEEITEGIISLIVEINVVTGEYKIYASLV